MEREPTSTEFHLGIALAERDEARKAAVLLLQHLREIPDVEERLRDLSGPLPYEDAEPIAVPKELRERVIKEYLALAKAQKSEEMPAVEAHSLVVSDAWYRKLDAGIRFAVRVLHARGIETGQSCEGGEGHAYDRPTVDLRDGGTRPVGFAALAALEDYGLRVRDIALLWHVDKGVPVENFWRVTLWQSWTERADDLPIFEWSYRATGGGSLTEQGHQNAAGRSQRARPGCGPVGHV